MIMPIRNLLALFALVVVHASTSAAPPLPECIPGVRGHTVSYPRVHSTTDYWHVAWFCTDKARTRVAVNGFTCRAGSCNEELLGKAIAAVTAASAKVATARQHWAAGVRTDCTAAQPDDPALCAARAAWIASEMPTWLREIRAELGRP